MTMSHLQHRKRSPLPDTPSKRRRSSPPPSSSRRSRSPPKPSRRPSPSPSSRRRSRSPPKPSRRSSFPSHEHIPDLPAKIRLLCEILATPSSPSASDTLSLLDGCTDLIITPSDLESVLRLSYSYPGPALAFFRWAGERHLNHAHSPYAWNLIVDLLGKNALFEAMWGSVRSMRDLNILSLATFASVFSSLAAAGKTEEALATFMSLNQYGIKRDTVALNSLLSALCRAGLTVDACLVLREARLLRARPDADSFAILLEGCENEKDDIAAIKVLDDMTATIGWDPANIQAYDSFLTTIISSSATGARSTFKYLDMFRRKGCSPGLKFFKTALKLCLNKSDERAAVMLWEDFIAPSKLTPDVEMYNVMILLECEEKRVDVAGKYFDAMVSDGAFPNSDTYNILFLAYLKARKLKEAAGIFTEMTKNECFPTEANINHAFKLSIDEKDPDMAIKYWLFMVSQKMQLLGESGNLLVSSLCEEMDRLPEACKYAEFMIDNGIKLGNECLGKLKKGLEKVRKGEIHERLLTKWRQNQKYDGYFLK